MKEDEEIMDGELIDPEELASKIVDAISERIEEAFDSEDKEKLEEYYDIVERIRDMFDDLLTDINNKIVELEEEECE